MGILEGWNRHAALGGSVGVYEVTGDAKMARRNGQKNRGVIILCNFGEALATWLGLCGVKGVEWLGCELVALRC